MLLKRQIRYGIDQVAGATGWLSRSERKMAGALTVLMYHRVLPEARCADYPLDSLVVSEEVFEQQVMWMSQRWEVLPLADAMRRSDQWGSGRPHVAITFDDGYADNYDIAAPILEKHGIRGTFFVTAGHIGTEDLLWFDRAALGWRHAPKGSVPETLDECMAMLKQAEPAARMRAVEEIEGTIPARERAKYRLMDADQVVELRRRGHEIGSHTMTHPLLTQLDDEELEQELRTSRQTIEQWISESITSIAYPNGSYDDRVVRATRSAGYSYACTTENGLNTPHTDRLRLARRFMKAPWVTTPWGTHSDTALRAEICGLHGQLRRFV
jgi:peptidoglycan/xylan/chitin deacetylase (PgdA/CDA1 family)